MPKIDSFQPIIYNFKTPRALGFRLGTPALLLKKSNVRSVAIFLPETVGHQREAYIKWAIFDRCDTRDRRAQTGSGRGT